MQSTVTGNAPILGNNSDDGIWKV